jgi:uncharacterized protein
MRTQLIHEDGGLRTFLAVLDTGDEVMESLRFLAEVEGLTAAHLTALGAFRTAELNYFDWQSKDYRSIPVVEQTEVASMVGDIAIAPDGGPALHVHAVLGRADGSALAGHLARGEVRPTLEVVVTEAPDHLRRQHDPDSGLPLIRARDAR